MMEHVDRFSAGLDDLTRKQQADMGTVLRVLHRTKRFSVFEATENQTIAKTMDRAMKIYLRHKGGEFPWTHVELNSAGLALIGHYDQCQITSAGTPS